jgi:outer membrane protein assembly factor BamB
VGGVLVHEETAYFVSGRHEGSGGGIFVYAVDLQSGRRIWGRRAETHRGVADVLTMNNNVLQMASSKFDPKTGKSVKSSTNGIQGGRLGLLSDGWYRRPIAMRKNLQLWHAGSRPKAQLLAFNDNATCGFRACESVNGGTGKMSGKALLFTKTKKKSDDWEVKLPLGVQMRGMALSPDRLYVAGQMLESEKSDPRQVVGIYSIGTGKRTAHFDLEAQPIHDGLVVTKRRVFVSTQDGRLFCLGEP